MSPITGRQKRPDNVPAVLLQARVEPDLKLAAHRAAAAVGLSLSAYVERVIAHAHADTDENGRPSWWPEAPGKGQEELPLTKAS